MERNKKRQFAICGKVKNESQIVVHEIIQKYGHKAVTMAEVHIVRDTKDSSVLHISMENCGNKLVQPFMLRTESWQHDGEVVWLFIMEGGFWNLVNKQELEEYVPF